VFGGTAPPALPCANVVATNGAPAGASGRGDPRRFATAVGPPKRRAILSCLSSPWWGSHCRRSGRLPNTIRGRACIRRWSPATGANY